MVTVDEMTGPSLHAGRNRRGAASARLAPFLVVAALCGAGAAMAAPFEVPPRPSGSVYDGARVMRQADVSAIEALSREIWEKARVALVVATIPDLGGEPLEDVSIRIAKTWGIGGKEDRGVLVLASIGDRKARIESGYGVEGYLPDGLNGEILDTDVLPRFRQGDVSGGLRAGAERIAYLTSREYHFTITGLAPPSRLSRKRGSPGGVVLILVVLVAIFGLRAFQLGNGNLLLGLMLLMATRRGRYTRRGGPFSGGFGGFGGGSSGGGGGFGGFGGGSFGGGGASRGW